MTLKYIIKNQTYADYVASCLTFAADTRDWLGLDDYKFYTSDRSGGWDENCDNNQGGIDLSWAFHMEPSEIIETAPHAFIGNLIDSVRQGIDEEFDAAQWSETLEAFGA